MNYRCLFFLLFSCGVFGQTLRPKVIFPAGFAFDMITHFNYSPHSRWLSGFNDSGECLVWDVQTGKEVWRSQSFRNTLQSFSYIPQYTFSHDDSKMLIPTFPDGGYELVDLAASQTLKEFKPDDPDEYFTSAFFSPGDNQVWFIGEKAGDPHIIELFKYDLNGRLLVNSQLHVPPLVVPNQGLMKLLMGKSFKKLSMLSYVMAAVFNPRGDQLFLSVTNGYIYRLILNDQTESYSQSQFSPVGNLPSFLAGEQLSFYKGKLIASGQMHTSELDKKTMLLTDTLTVIDPGSLYVEKRIPSTVIVVDQALRTNSIRALPIRTNQAQDIVFSVNPGDRVHYSLLATDILSGAPVFAIPAGNPHHNMTTSYQPGVINGGYIVAVSPDRKYMAECTRDVVIHNLSNKSIQSVVSAIRGGVRLAAPLFLDSTRVLLPKLNNDGFVLNLATGKVDRLERELDCQDTLMNGANSYYRYDDGRQYGIQNSVLSPFKEQFITSNLTPNWQCNLNRSREIVVWDRRTLKRLQTYAYDDREYVYTMSGVADHPKKFLINYKLVDFEQREPRVTPLMIRRGRDTFYAANPVYLKKRGQIVAITTTRTKPGSPDLIFASWDSNGTLLKSIVFKKPKNKTDFQTIVTGSRLSPDSSKLLLCLYDGSARLVDLDTWTVTSTYEHGQPLSTLLQNIMDHDNIVASAFIDNRHFVTNGGNKQILLWTTGSSQPDKVINKDPFYLLSLVPSPDGKYLLGLSFDKTVHFINLQTGEDDAVFTAANADAFTLINKDGYYLSNQKSNNDISFVYRQKVYEFSQFDLALNRPDKVLSGLGYLSSRDAGDLAAAREKRLQRYGYPVTELTEGYDAPLIELKNLPNLLDGTNRSSVNFTVEATDVLNPVYRLFVNVNGVPFYGRNGLALLPKSSVSVPVQLPLSSGNNLVTVTVMNKVGGESLQQSFTVIGPNPATKPNLYMVMVASGNFTQAGHNLKYPVSDARDVIRLFKERSSSFSHIYVDSLFNQQATLRNIKGMKAKLAASAPDDLVVLYYAGHGLVDDKQDYYLATNQSDFNRPSAGGLSYNDWEGLVDSIPARNKLVLIDACYSGEIDKNESTISNADYKRQQRVNQLLEVFFSDLRKSNGASEIGAAGSAEQALEVDALHNGVFTYFLKKGLHDLQADSNNDGHITIAELADYLRTSVFNYTGRQHPTLRHQNIVNNMVIW